jgi:peptidoglycan/xylan/chitin deacetylase (PgdA/CDA1 family)
MTLKERGVGISFDDGPNPENAQQVLGILREYDCQATFFWIVEFAREFSEGNIDSFERVRMEIDGAGHEIGFHAPEDYFPTLLSRLFFKFTKRQMEVSLAELEDLTKQKIHLYRPHYSLQPISFLFVTQLGLRPVLGSFVHYAEPMADIDSQIEKFSSAKPGEILIFHDGITQERKETYITEVLPEVLSNLKKQNLMPTKVSNIIY